MWISSKETLDTTGHMSESNNIVWIFQSKRSHCVYPESRLKATDLFIHDIYGCHSEFPNSRLSNFTPSPSTPGGTGHHRCASQTPAEQCSQGSLSSNTFCKCLDLSEISIAPIGTHFVLDPSPDISRYSLYRPLASPFSPCRCPGHEHSTFSLTTSLFQYHVSPGEFT